MEKIFTADELKKMSETFDATQYEKIVVPERTSSENIFYGAGFYVCKREDRYWLSYSSAYHGGGSVIHEISEDEYVEIRSGSISFSHLYEKYPEENGDRERSAKIEARWEKLEK